VLQKVRKELPVALKGEDAEQTATVSGQSRVCEPWGRHEQCAALKVKEWFQQR